VVGMSETNWRWTTVALNVALGTALMAGLFYLRDGTIASAGFAVFESAMLIGILLRWLYLRILPQQH
jgi:hypothetical protein